MSKKVLIIAIATAMVLLIVIVAFNSDAAKEGFNEGLNGAIQNKTLAKAVL